MAELAKNYHKNLQHASIDDEDKIECKTIIEEALTYLPEEQLLENLIQTEMFWTVKTAQVEKAIKLSKTGSSTEINGCLYELWKALTEQHQMKIQKCKPSFNVVKTMTMIFQDIQTNRIHDNAEFTLGWMCPLYKRKDKTEISNYQPITLLNTDYKLLTKVLALQLMDEISHLLHHDQSGFVPR